MPQVGQVRVSAEADIREFEVLYGRDSAVGRRKTEGGRIGPLRKREPDAHIARKAVVEIQNRCRAERVDAVEGDVIQIADILSVADRATNRAKAVEWDILAVIV